MYCQKKEVVHSPNGEGGDSEVLGVVLGQNLEFFSITLNIISSNIV